MDKYFIMEDISRIGNLCSYLGSKVLSGDVEAVKHLYGTAWKEHPALIKTITLLQECLTLVEIEDDVNGIYCGEFLYYWGMICLGEQSRLICRDLGTAEICFRKILDVMPKVKARLAFIELLESDEPAKSDLNAERIDVLRKWASMQDLFSRIVLAKIIFYDYLNNNQTNDSELPIKALRLLELSCQKGHPVAIRLWNEVLAYVGTPTSIGMQISKTQLNEDILYDFNHLQICK